MPRTIPATPWPQVPPICPGECGYQDELVAAAYAKETFDEHKLQDFAHDVGKPCSCTPTSTNPTALKQPMSAVARSAEKPIYPPDAGAKGDVAASSEFCRSVPW